MCLAVLKGFFGRLRASDWFIMLCRFAVLAGIGLRFCRLGEALWLDEILTLHTASLGSVGILKDLTYGSSGATPPLFYLLLAGWMKFFPRTEVSLHFFTAVIGVFGIAAAWKVSAGLIGRRAGAATAALLAIHPFHLAHSQEIRPYGLLVLFTFLSFYFLQKALERDNWRDWILFSATGLACLYTHNYAVFLVAAEITAGAAASFCLTKKRLKILAVSTIISAGFVPWIPVLIIQAAKPIYYHLHPPAIRDIGLTLRSLFGFCVAAGDSFSAPLHPGALYALACAAFAAFCAPALIRSNRRLFLNILVVAALTLLAPVIISLKKPMYDAGRHSIIVLPFVCIIMGWSISSLNNKKWRIGLLAILLAVQGLTVRAYFRAPKSCYRDIAACLSVIDRPDLKIAVLPPGISSVFYCYQPSARDKKSQVQAPDRTQPGQPTKKKPCRIKKCGIRRWQQSAC